VRAALSKVAMKAVVMVKGSTFFENIFCRANPNVAVSALIRPTESKDSSVTDAITTPPTVGRSEQ